MSKKNENGRAGGKLHRELQNRFKAICFESGYKKFKSVTLGSIGFSPDIFCYRPSFTQTDYKPLITHLRYLSVIIGEVVITHFTGFPSPLLVTNVIRKNLTVFDVMGPGHIGNVFDIEKGSSLEMIRIRPISVDISILYFLIQQNGFFQCEFSESPTFKSNLSKDDVKPRETGVR